MPKHSRVAQAMASAWESDLAWAQVSALVRALAQVREPAPMVAFISNRGMTNRRHHARCKCATAQDVVNER